ncbi:translation initiation factor IF3-1, mitochondrial isoform X2 [Andrographis paniculata]|uniref:translation initiation factor IF3-1, mitochondrial isoform X2 n=1 Tax=Andrographis paniculata TaxID=175694 RepID=UPI0021E7C2F7|nr:translation initiation factor IF3-1, mitochondrial isoform X2 [Andrographis paniculata]
MAFLSRFRQSKTKFNIFFCNSKRCYILNYQSTVASLDIRSRTLFPVLNSPNSTKHSIFSDFCSNIRFYAAPIQANQKKEERDTSGPRLNEDITAPSIRLVSDEGHMVMSRYEALTRARSHKLDLVEVDRHAIPPVCKIFDYHKEKYLHQTKEKERAKSKTTLKAGSVKEVRFAAKIKPKDLQIKADMVKRLMESGHRVKCTAIEPTENMDLEHLISTFSALIKDIAVEETGPQIEKKQAYIVVRHAKFGPPKKAGKKASKAAVSPNTSSQSSKNQPFQDDCDAIEGGSDTGEDEVHATKSQSAVSDGGDSSHSAFYFTDEENMVPKSPTNDQSTVSSRSSPYVMDENPIHIAESAATRAPSSPSFGVNRYARDPAPVRAPPQQAKENRYARDGTPGRPPSRIPVSAGGNGGQFPNRGRQQEYRLPQQRPPQQDAFGSSPANSPSKNYGIFSSGNSNPTGNEQNASPDMNRYRKK